MLSLGCVLISDLVVANLSMHSLPDIILLYLAAHFYTEGVFACMKYNYGVCMLVGVTNLTNKNNEGYKYKSSSRNEFELDY